MTMKFEAGKTYSTRSVCDHESVISISVVSRTPKTIKTACGKTLRISECNGRERVKPWGSYSMAPVITAKQAPAEQSKLASDKTSGVDLSAPINTEASIANFSGALESPATPQQSARIYDFAAYRA